MNDLQAIVCGGAALVLGSSAVRKALDAAGFLGVLIKHPVLRRWAPLLVRSVPAAELGLALALVAAPAVEIPALAASALFAGFILVTLSAPPGACGCGPFVPERRSLRHLMNFGFVVGLPLSLVDSDAAPRGDRLLVVASLVIGLLTVKVVAAARSAWRPARAESTAPALPLDIPVRLVSRP